MAIGDRATVSPGRTTSVRWRYQFASLEDGSHALVKMHDVGVVQALLDYRESYLNRHH